ncbi:hypothetical protein RchiOBHm_Chr6g0278551 [Rosa chinensis]|uniref:Uncharacterized protein n=1 Tax=Rosa chinensis TaxID=74649 RepID=A0A2P6PST0_ROSCH|nr:hypothetical protein RchiOBHm_Chr6g0278551 [Rosa chinensis]
MLFYLSKCQFESFRLLNTGVLLTQPFLGFQFLECHLRPKEKNYHSINQDCKHYKICRGDHEVRCVQRKLLLESLANELPSGTTRFSSKFVSIEESGYFKFLHLWKSAISGQANFKSNHGFDPTSMRFFRHGVRSGVIPCDKKAVYRPAQLRQFVLSKLGKIPDEGSEGKLMTLLNRILGPLIPKLLLKKADFDCGKLNTTCITFYWYLRYAMIHALKFWNS